MAGQEPKFKPIVFISHSAKDDFARRVLNALDAELAQRFEVLLDRKRLQPGYAWRSVINTWIGLCHAAVIVFSRDALTSDWVLKEATNLTWRRALDPYFVFIPLLLPGVDRQALDSGPFSPLALNEIQAAAGDTPAAIAAKVADRLKPLIDQLASRSPLQELERQLAGILRSQVHARDPRVLESIAGDTGLEMGGWDPDHDASTRFARAIFHAEPTVVRLAVQRLVPYLDTADANEMLAILSPFWVNPDVVAPIPAVARREPGRRAVWMQGQRPEFTGRAYIERACCHRPRWPIVNSTGVGGEDHAGAMIREIRESFAVELDSQDTGEDLDLMFEVMEETWEVPPAASFVVVPGETDPRLLARVRSAFPNVTFVLVWKEAPPDPAALRNDGVEALLPPPGERERTAYVQWRAAQLAITQIENERKRR